MVKNLIFPHKNKKALSNLVAYVLLISITLALSVLVYNWLRFYVAGEDIDACPEGVNVIITEYNCVEDTGVTFTIKNKGRFSVDGFTVRVHDREDAEFGFHTMNDTGLPMSPGDELNSFVDFSYDGHDFEYITLLEVQPFIKDGEDISCKAIATQRIPRTSCN